MNQSNAHYLLLAAVLTFLGGATAQSQSTPFSAKAETLPFPPDAHDLKFHTTFDLIYFSSGSSLPAVTDFYRRELPKRGWTEDKSAVEQDENSIEMTFKHDDAQIVVELDTASDGVRACFNCEGLEFREPHDPAALLAAGVPQPRSHLFLQKEIPRPAEIQNQEYLGDMCVFESNLSLTEAFDFYGKALKEAGWRETRKPSISDDRLYTEFERRGDEVSVNVVPDEVGSQIVLRYETETKEPPVPPLPDPGAGLAGTAGSAQTNQDAIAPKAVALIPVDVSKNTGSATFTLGGKKYSFKHAAAYRTKEDGANSTQLLFSDRPIPLPRIQDLLARQDRISIDDIFGENSPSYLRMNVNKSINFSFKSSGVSIGNTIDKPANDLREEKGRVSGTIKMLEPQESFSDNYQLEATIDAVILTPQTKLDSAK